MQPRPAVVSNLPRRDDSASSQIGGATRAGLTLPHRKLVVQNTKSGLQRRELFLRLSELVTAEKTGANQGETRSL